jgi:putative colanic acid biosynthesis acetyltransferase WcaF
MHNTDTMSGPSFSLRNRMARGIWGVVSVLLFRFSPRPFHRWRSFLLRLFGAKIGKGVHVYPGVKVWAPWNLVIGDETGIADGTTLYSQGEILIGKRSVISQGTYLSTGTHDYTKTGFPLITFPIRIGNNVWIAAEAFIHPGITIADNCVIGARSVVTKDQPQDMVCAGNPCRPLKRRILS